MFPLGQSLQDSIESRLNLPGFQFAVRLAPRSTMDFAMALIFHASVSSGGNGSIACHAIHQRQVTHWRLLLELNIYYQLSVSSKFTDFLCNFPIHKVINIKSLHSKDCLEQNSSDKCKWSPLMWHCMSPFPWVGSQQDWHLPHQAIRSSDQWCALQNHHSPSPPHTPWNSPACCASPGKAPRQTRETTSIANMTRENKMTLGSQNSCWIGRQRSWHRSEIFCCNLCFQPIAIVDML